MFYANEGQDTFQLTLGGSACNCHGNLLLKIVVFIPFFPMSIKLQDVMYEHLFGAARSRGLYLPSLWNSIITFLSNNFLKISNKNTQHDGLSACFSFLDLLIDIHTAATSSQVAFYQVKSEVSVFKIKSSLET